MFAKKKDWTGYFFFILPLKDTYCVHKGSYVVSMNEMLNLNVLSIAVCVAATHLQILYVFFQ